MTLADFSKLSEQSFNSNLVQLKVSGNFYQVSQKMCFNSNLVQLKGRHGSHVVALPEKFQFQSGAIKGG